jgi:hypothetical protein
MFGASFRLLARPLIPPARGWKQAAPLLIVALFAVSCGASDRRAATAAGETKVVAGPGFRFTAPASWRVRRTDRSAAARDPDAGVGAVSAVVYRLGKPYEPAEFDASVAELDGVARRLARASGGELTGKETTTVDGRKVRAYRFTAQAADGSATEDRVAFVLSGKREVQLLCVAPKGAGDPAGACGLLFDSFSLDG